MFQKDSFSILHMFFPQDVPHISHVPRAFGTRRQGHRHALAAKDVRVEVLAQHVLGRLGGWWDGISQDVISILSIIQIYLSIYLYLYIYIIAFPL